MYVQLLRRTGIYQRRTKGLWLPVRLDQLTLPDGRLNEELLLYALPRGWLPAPPEEILVSLAHDRGSTGLRQLSRFRPWQAFRLLDSGIMAGGTAITAKLLTGGARAARDGGTVPRRFLKKICLSGRAFSLKKHLRACHISNMTCLSRCSQKCVLRKGNRPAQTAKAAHTPFRRGFQPLRRKPFGKISLTPQKPRRACCGAVFSISRKKFQIQP